MSEKTTEKDFWETVGECNHEYSEYFKFVSCDTPYCGGQEERCNKCHVYMSDCGCHYNAGMSGWSSKRWSKQGENPNAKLS